MNLENRQIFINTNIQQTLSVFSSVITDENTHKHCWPLIQSCVPNALVITIKSGEEEKTLATCTQIWQYMTDHEMDRKGLVINLGGGVIGDMGGFCAATYKRGLEFVQIPTTLLSQVDASVGGKLGIDFNSYKNHIGVFQEPRAVLISIDFLKTLDPRELRSGFAEIIKHCLIADKAKWDVIKTKSLEEQDLTDLARHSVEIKAHITDVDPKEKGLRKILNFGHTIGHAVESFYLSTNKRLLHGEAIAVGMIAESFVAHKKGFISLAECEEIKSYIISIFGHPQVPSTDFEEIIPLTIQDKKNENSVVLASLLEEIGKANFNIELTAQDISEGLEYYNK